MIYQYKIVRELVSSDDIALVRELVDDELTHTYGIVSSDGTVEYQVPAEVMALLDPYGLGDRRQDTLQQSLDGGGSATDDEQAAMDECDNVLVAIARLVNEHRAAAYTSGVAAGRQQQRLELQDMLGVDKVVAALQDVANELTSLSNLAGRNAQ